MFADVLEVRTVSIFKVEKEAKRRKSNFAT
jgi:hypothetical protein